MLSATTEPYVIAEPTMEVTFGPETKHPGVTLEIRSVLTVGDAIDLEPLLEGFDGRSQAEKAAALRLFADHLIVDWNLHERARDDHGNVQYHDDGRPVLVKVPVSGETFMRRIDFTLAMAALTEWQKVMAEQIGISAPLDEPSTTTLPGETAPTREQADALLSLLSYGEPKRLS